ncbi:hypothetical protein NDU88_002770 [Pleurodeles waltl]|uniref:Uncharacterized protein n=1 Tax=Pleurodeles waltl TaxID=8319 RepID=A0AAV7PBU4_PLEWA|nr:hypothetical protein NDU88_002770 [Pleurodeles waltl]
MASESPRTSGFKGGAGRMVHGDSKSHKNSGWQRRRAQRRRYTEKQHGRTGRRKKTDSRRREVGRRGRNSSSPGGATRDYQPCFRRSVADSGVSWDQLRGTREVGKGEEGD